MDSTRGVAKSWTRLSDFHFHFTLVIQSCPTLQHLDYSPPGSLVRGISQARILEWVAISFFRGSSPTQGLNPHLRLDR